MNSQTLLPEAQRTANDTGDTQVIVSWPAGIGGPHRYAIRDFKTYRRVYKHEAIHKIVRPEVEG